MKAIVLWAQSTVAAFGGAGLALIAMLDASVLSLPEIVDILVIWLVVRNEAGLPYYVAMATLGSIAGCLVLYWPARKGGEAFLRKRFQDHHVERGMRLIQRYGVLAVLVPSMLPPPTPFKLFVLLAGVARVSTSRFILAVAVGRGLRFLLVGLLAVWLGDHAIAYIRTHGTEAAIILALGAVGFAAAYLLWRRRRLQASGL